LYNELGATLASRGVFGIKKPQDGGSNLGSARAVPSTISERNLETDRMGDLLELLLY
jgi:hypothetical protein